MLRPQRMSQIFSIGGLLCLAVAAFGAATDAVLGDSIMSETSTAVLAAAAGLYAARTVWELIQQRRQSTEAVSVKDKWVCPIADSSAIHELVAAIGELRRDQMKVTTIIEALARGQERSAENQAEIFSSISTLKRAVDTCGGARR